MNEPTKKEMLEFIDDLIKMPEWDWNEDSIEILKSIRRLIEMGPRVTREFVIRKANEYSLPHFWLFQFVRELGIEIEEEKEA